MAHVVGHGVVIGLASRAGRRRFQVEVTRGVVVHMIGLRRCSRVGDADSRLVGNTYVPRCDLALAMEAAGFNFPGQALRTGKSFVEGNAGRAGPSIHGNLLDSGQRTKALFDCGKIQNAEEIADLQRHVLHVLFLVRQYCASQVR